MSENDEIDYLKRKRLLEMKKRLLIKKAAEEKQQEKPKEPEDILKTVFTESAWKIWRVAEQQYSQTTEDVKKALVAMIEAGKINEKITGEQIYWLFNQLGFPLRLETKIRILESGEMKTIAEKLRDG